MVAVIILGNKLQSNQLNPELKGRMDCGINVFKTYSANVLILSGGRSNPVIEVEECELMKNYAIQNGVDEEKILLEKSSLDTIGNAVFTRKIIDSIPGFLKIFIVTSCYHKERACYIFNKCYGNHFELNFNNCYDYPGNAEHEQKSLNLAMKFFEDIEPGNFEKISNRLYKSHLLYIPNK